MSYNGEMKWSCLYLRSVVLETFGNIVNFYCGKSVQTLVLNILSTRITPSLKLLCWWFWTWLIIEPSCYIIYRNIAKNTDDEDNTAAKMNAASCVERCQESDPSGLGGLHQQPLQSPPDGAGGCRRWVHSIRLLFFVTVGASVSMFLMYAPSTGVNHDELVGMAKSHFSGLSFQYEGDAIPVLSPCRFTGSEVRHRK